MKEKKYVVAMIVLAMFCLLSFYVHFSFKHNLDAIHITLKNGIFDINRKTYAIDFIGPSNSLYDLILEVSGASEAFLKDVNQKEINLGINGEIRNSSNVAIRTFSQHEWKNVLAGSAKDSFRLDLATLSIVRGEKYRLVLSFESDDIRFNEAPKEIFLRQQRDYAAVPWLALGQLLGLISAVVILLILLALCVILFVINKKRMGDRQP